MDQHKSLLALGTGLISSPVWAQIIHIYSATMEVVSVTAGAIVGVVTLYRMWRHRQKD